MSAYIVNPESIAIIAAAKNSNEYYPAEERIRTAYADARILIQENVNSVSYRYEDTPSDPEKAIPIWFTKLDYKGYLAEVKTEVIRQIQLQSRKGIRSDVFADTKEAWRIVNSYIYQSCEHPEWEGSPGNIIALNAGHDIAYKLLDEDRYGRAA